MMEKPLSQLDDLHISLYGIAPAAPLSVLSKTIAELTAWDTWIDSATRGVNSAKAPKEELRV